MRNAGIQNLYKRGKVFYFVKNAKWESLHTGDKREAKRLMREIIEREIALKFFKKAGLAGVADKLAQVEKKIDLIAAAPSQQSLAPGFANSAGGSKKPEREDFETAGKAFLAQIPWTSQGAEDMWKGAQKKLLETLRDTVKYNTADLSGLTLWERFEIITPSGSWNQLRAAGAGNSTLNHQGAYLRKFVPHFVALNYLPERFVQNSESIPHLTVHKRKPRIPSPEEMDMLAAEWKSQDEKLAVLLQAMRFSGARKGAFLHKTRGLRWKQVDLANSEIEYHQKGDKKERVPMGPQLCELLGEWKQRSNPQSEEELVFPFGSTLEDRAQEIMKSAAEKLGGNLVDMHHFHALKHYFKSTHQVAGTPDRICDLLTFNTPGGREGSGDGYRHCDLIVMCQWADKVIL